MPVTTAAEGLLSIRQAAPELLVRGRDVAISVLFELDGASPTPSAATVSLLAPDGTALLTDEAATPGAGSATYTISAATLPATLALGEGYQLVWQLTLSGVPYTHDREAAVILRPLHPVITDTDIEESYPNIASDRPTSITSLLTWRREAWNRIITRLISEGHLTYKIKSPWAFREAHIEATLWLFYRFHFKDQQDERWKAVSDSHLDAYHAAWGRISFTVDADHDGRPDDPHTRQSALRVTHIGGAPGRTYPGGM